MILNLEYKKIDEKRFLVNLLWSKQVGMKQLYGDRDVELNTFSCKILKETEPETKNFWAKADIEIPEIVAKNLKSQGYQLI